jgi:hypothetical protein
VACCWSAKNVETIQTDIPDTGKPLLGIGNFPEHQSGYWQVPLVHIRDSYGSITCPYQRGRFHYGTPGSPLHQEKRKLIQDNEELKEKPIMPINVEGCTIPTIKGKYTI